MSTFNSCDEIKESPTVSMLKDENGQLMGVDTRNLLIANSGNDLPVIDLSSVSQELAYLASDVDLVVLEGMYLASFVPADKKQSKMRGSNEAEVVNTILNPVSGGGSLSESSGGGLRSPVGQSDYSNPYAMTNMPWR